MPNIMTRDMRKYFSDTVLSASTQHCIKNDSVFVFVFTKLQYILQTSYRKCPKISYTKVFDKMAYASSADPNQTAPEGAV